MTASHMQPMDEFKKTCEFLANETEFLIHKKPCSSADSFWWVIPSFVPIDFSKPSRKKETNLQVLFTAKRVSGEWLRPDLDTRKYSWEFSRAEYVKITNVEGVKID